MTFTKPVAVISDVHGCYKTLMALVAKIPATHQVILNGDMVDRGPNSAGVLNWAIQNNAPAVLGNHEDLMLYHHRIFHPGQPYDDRKIWIWNGGGKTLESFPDHKVPASVLKWVNELPMGIEAVYDGVSYSISHTGYGNSKDESRLVKLWLRYGSETETLPSNYDYFVFGHTQKKEPWLEKNFAMIDTGCAYPDRGMGKLTALLLPEKQVIQQENIE